MQKDFIWELFKITGSVILYGVVAAYVFGLIRIFIMGG